MVGKGEEAPLCLSRKISAGVGDEAEGDERSRGYMTSGARMGKPMLPGEVGVAGLSEIFLGSARANFDIVGRIRP